MKFDRQACGGDFVEPASPTLAAGSRMAGNLTLFFAKEIIEAII